MTEKISVVSVRIDNKQIELLEAIAEFDGITLGDEIRNAITIYISSRMSDKNKIAEEIAKYKERHDLLLNKLLKCL